MKSSPMVRFSAAAGIYFMLMWGYTVLPTGQWFAAFLALMMCVMVIFWANESNDEVRTTAKPESSSASEEVDPISVTFAADPSLEASVLRLDSLKTELKDQYAQFGRDQSLLNRKSLGSWNGTRDPRD